MLSKSQSHNDVKRKLGEETGMQRIKSLRLQKRGSAVDFTWLDGLVDQDLGSDFNEVDSHSEDEDYVEGTIAHKGTMTQLHQKHNNSTNEPDSPGNDSLLSVDSHTSSNSSISNEVAVSDVDLNDSFFSSESQWLPACASTPPLSMSVGQQNNVGGTFGIAYDQGLRRHMEDTAIVTTLPKLLGKHICRFAGVYDGHNGGQASELLAKHLHSAVATSEEYAQGKVVEALVKGFDELENMFLQVVRQHVRQRLSTKSSATSNTAIAGPSGLVRTKPRRKLQTNSCINSGKENNENVITMNDEEVMLERVGSTAVVALHAKPNSESNEVASSAGKLYVAWVGDSRAILSRNGMAVELTKDHRASSPAERQRIEAAGGKVDSSGRLFRDLALSRAVGNFFYKGTVLVPKSTLGLADVKVAVEQHRTRVANEFEDLVLVTAPTSHQSRVAPVEQDLPSSTQPFSRLTNQTTSASPLIHTPEVVEMELQPNDTFVLLGSDGIWDVVSNHEAVELVQAKLATGKTAQEAAQALVDEAQTRGSGDNKSAIVFLL